MQWFHEKLNKRNRNKRLQLYNSDPIKNIQIAKYTKYHRTIHNIGIDPFYCMYWIQVQLVMYKKSHKQDVNCFLAIDITGNIAKELWLPNGETSLHLFLYESILYESMRF